MKNKTIAAGALLSSLIQLSACSHKENIKTSELMPKGAHVSSSHEKLYLTQISNGKKHACGLEHNTGKVYCWGDNFLGQLGSGDRNDSSFPREVKLSKKGRPLFIESLSVGRNGACALDKETKNGYCWGANLWGQSGNGSTKTVRIPAPVKYQNGTNIKFSKLSMGHYHTCGIEAGTGAAYCWGGNFDGALGNGSVSTEEKEAWFTPSRVLGPDGAPGSFLRFSKIKAYDYRTCAIEVKTNSLYCWGDLMGVLKTGSGETPPHGKTQSQLL
jgi:alpha-tubulin suppressor-like RCC1 family protein